MLLGPGRYRRRIDPARGLRHPLPVRYRVRHALPCAATLVTGSDRKLVFGVAPFGRFHHTAPHAQPSGRWPVGNLSFGKLVLCQIPDIAIPILITSKRRLELRARIHSLCRLPLSAGLPSLSESAMPVAFCFIVPKSPPAGGPNDKSKPTVSRVQRQTVGQRWDSSPPVAAGRPHILPPSSFILGFGGSVWGLTAATWQIRI